MPKILLYILILIFGQQLIGQENDTTIYNFKDIDEKPILITDSANYQIDEILNYVRPLQQWPETKIDCTGRVIISFVIEKDGTISQIKYERRLCPGIDENSYEIIKTMKKWEPAKIGDKIVRTKIYLPISWLLI